VVERVGGGRPAGGRRDGCAASQEQEKDGAEKIRHEGEGVGYRT
jgi:hypothetical protein